MFCFLKNKTFLKSFFLKLGTPENRRRGINSRADSLSASAIPRQQARGDRDVSRASGEIKYAGTRFRADHAFVTRLRGHLHVGRMNCFVLGKSIWGKDGRTGDPRVPPCLTSVGVLSNPCTSRMCDPSIQAASEEAQVPVVQTGQPWGRRHFLWSSAPRDLPSAAGPGHGGPQSCLGSDGVPWSLLFPLFKSRLHLPCPILF